LGSGPGGRVIKKDLENFKQKPPTPSSFPLGAAIHEKDITRVRLKGMRKIIAQNMSLSKQKIPHYTYVDEVDFTHLENLRIEQADKTGSQKFSPLVFIAKVTAGLLKQFPDFNAILDEDRGEIILRKKINLGIAVSTEGGLTVPVIQGADQLSLKVLSDQIKNLADLARKRKIPPKMLKGGTFTITSLGNLGGLFATPIIRYPEIGILGVYRIIKKPRYIKEKLVPRLVANISITLDHRIVDGVAGAKFIQALKKKLETDSFENY